MAVNFQIFRFFFVGWVLAGLYGQFLACPKPMDVQSLIDSADIVVFASDTCGYCKKAIEQLTDNGYSLFGV